MGPVDGSVRAAVAPEAYVFCECQVQIRSGEVKTASETPLLDIGQVLRSTRLPKVIVADHLARTLRRANPQGVMRRHTSQQLLGLDALETPRRHALALACQEGSHFGVQHELQLGEDGLNFGCFLLEVGLVDDPGVSVGVGLLGVDEVGHVLGRQAEQADCLLYKLPLVLHQLCHQPLVLGLQCLKYRVICQFLKPAAISSELPLLILHKLDNRVLEAPIAQLVVPSKHGKQRVKGSLRAARLVAHEEVLARG